MAMRGDFTCVVGKRVTGVVVMEYPTRSPRTQFFLVFADSTNYEIYFHESVIFETARLDQPGCGENRLYVRLAGGASGCEEQPAPPAVSFHCAARVTLRSTRVSEERRFDLKVLDHFLGKVIAGAVGHVMTPGHHCVLLLFEDGSYLELVDENWDFCCCSEIDRGGLAKVRKYAEFTPGRTTLYEAVIDQPAWPRAEDLLPVGETAPAPLNANVPPTALLLEALHKAAEGRAAGRLLGDAAPSIAHNDLPRLGIRLLKCHSLFPDLPPTCGDDLSEATQCDWIDDQLFHCLPYQQDLASLDDARFTALQAAWPEGFHEVVFDDGQEDEEHAAALIEPFLEWMDRLELPVMTDFGATETEMEEYLAEEFVRMIRDWRKLALGRLEQRLRSTEPKGKVPTWDLLRQFGFTAGGRGTLDLPSTLVLDLGSLTLKATRSLDSCFREVIRLLGVLHGPRTLAEVDFELPLELDSAEQCAAWVVWHLDQAAGPGGFRPTHQVGWLEAGRSQRHLLPWVAKMAAYDARPRCVAAHDWAKVAIRSLAALLSTVNADENVVFDFDGAVLTVRCGHKVVALPAAGQPWAASYYLPAERLRELPRRLRGGTIEFSVFDAVLHIGTRAFTGVRASARTACEGAPA